MMGVPVVSDRPRVVAPSAPATPDSAPLDDGVRWLALLIRQGCLLIVRGIEARYGLRADTRLSRDMLR